MKTKLTTGLIALAFVSYGASASEAAAPTNAPGDWKAEALQFDGAYWDAYNKCDIARLNDLNAADIEFYHDKGGVTLGRAAFAGAMKGICDNRDQRLRRAAVDGTVQVFPMEADGKLYGVVISGEHRFYVSEKGAPEYPANRARFTHLVVKKDGTWQVARVLSYDHGPVAYENKRTEAILPTAQLDRLSGTYTTKNKGSSKVTRAGNTLVLDFGGKNLVFFPENKDRFFLKERDLTLDFSQAGNDGAMRFHVRENGAEVDEAVR